MPLLAASKRATIKEREAPRGRKGSTGDNVPGLRAEVPGASLNNRTKVTGEDNFALAA